MATIGALWTLGKHGLTGRAQIELEDDDGSYKGTVANLYDLALRLSKNVEYNRLMLIAGYDAINENYMSERHGMPHMILQRRYARKIPGANLRRSPPIRYQQGKQHGVLPERIAKLDYPRCPREGNCASMFELQEGLRRLVFHREIPASERFPIGAWDRRQVMKALRKAKDKFGDGARRALRHPVTIYNKAGRYPGDDHLDNALIIDTVNRRRYLVAMSVPYLDAKEPDQVSFDKLVEMGFHTLRTLSTEPAHRRPRLQLDAGIPLALRLARIERPGTFSIRISAPRRRATRLRLWIGPTRKRLTRDDEELVARHTFEDVGKHLVVLQAWRGRRVVAYRAQLIEVTAGPRRTSGSSPR